MSRRGRAAASRSALRAALAVAGTLASLLLVASAATAAPFDPGASSIPSVAKVTAAPPGESPVTGVTDAIAGAQTAPAGPSAPQSAPAPLSPAKPSPEPEKVVAAVESIADQPEVQALVSDRTHGADTDEPAGPVAGLADSVGKLTGSVIRRSPVGDIAKPLRQSLSDDVVTPLLQQSGLGEVVDALAPALGATPLLTPVVDALAPTLGAAPLLTRVVDAAQTPSGPAPASLAVPEETVSVDAPVDPTIAETASPVRGVGASSPSRNGALAIDAGPSFGDWATAPVTRTSQSGAAVPLDSPAPAHGSPVGASGSASGFTPLPVLAALLLAALIAPILRTVPKEAPAFLRPAPYIALLERPG